MQRLLRIVLFITFMLLIILWFSTIFNTCNKNEDGTANTETVSSETDSSEIFQDLDDEFFEDDQALFEEETDGKNTGPSNRNTDVNETSDMLENQDAEDIVDYTGTTKNTSSSSSSSASNSVTNGNYLVVAGSFLVKGNAENMRKKLNNMGYTAEVRNFNYSQYHSVIAGRYANKSSADQVTAALKSKGISCYVHKRRP